MTKIPSTWSSRRPPPLAPALGAPVDYRIARGLVRHLATIFGGMEIEGIDRIPLTGRLIIAANHVSVLDPPFLGVIVSGLRFPMYLAKKELFQVPLFGWMISRWGAIPLERKRGDMGAIRSAISILDQEGCIVLFPEGSRRRSGQVRRAKPGVGLIARESGAPVIPVRLRNTESLFGPKPFRVKFGEPMRFARAGNSGDCQRFADELMERIWSL